MLYDGIRLEVQADVTSTQRFSLCSETASATTSLSEKSVNASIALDDGAASTRALAGSVLNFKVFHIVIKCFILIMSEHFNKHIILVVGLRFVKRWKKYGR